MPSVSNKTPLPCHHVFSRRSGLNFVLHSFLFFLLLSAPLSATEIEVPPPEREGLDWPYFLGPQEDGTSLETGLMKKWPADGPPLEWKIEMGIGYSAPSILGNRLVVHHRPRDGRQPGPEEVVECLRADTGERVWRFKYPSQFQDPYGYNEGPRCSPVLTENRCYTLGAEGMLLCLDLQSGKEIWRNNTHAEFNVPDGFFGTGCNPILEEDLLLVLVGGQPNSGVVAFNKETGEIVWQNVGKSTWDGADTSDKSNPKYEWTGEEMVKSYSSPIVATIHGKRHLLCLMRQGLVSLDPQTGEENFKYWFKARVYESVNAARPVVIGNQIFLSAAYRVGSALLEVNDDGKSYKEVWRDPRTMLTHWSTAIHHEGYIYGFSGRHENEGRLKCINLKSGRMEWQSRGFDGNPTDKINQNRITGMLTDKETGNPVAWPWYGRGSKIQVGDQFIVLGERGTLALVEVNPKEFKEISRAFVPDMKYPTWAAPVLSRKRLYLRSEEYLYCFDLAEK